MKYSTTSAMLCSVVTTMSSSTANTRRAALPAIAERRTLLSAATLFMLGELTLNLFVGDACRV